MMGCLCSKGSEVIDDVAVNAKHHSRLRKSSVAPSRREEKIGEIDKVRFADGSTNSRSRCARETKVGGVPVMIGEGNGGKTIIIERPKYGHRHKREMTIDLDGTTRIAKVPWGAKGEQCAAGWPSWLSAVAGEAIQGLLPRRAESFEKIEKVGQGTYSSVYRARDLTANKIVAMKKVKFVNMDPESVRFMAREISILRRLDHPNVLKLEAIVTSRISETLYLVFEYMEHDLAGLLSSPKVNLTEPQIKCYMQQLFHGLQHCHNRGVLHRDIKGSNILVGNNGILKIGDFGLATTFTPNQKEPLTSRVVTLWYRAPELLFGATNYGVAIDMWSVGCILGELFAGKPIMPGRTEVEQMHKIFKLCGSPSEEYWRRSKLTHATTTFKPQQQYRRCILDTFKDFPASALALVDILLSVDPAKRGNATSALRSEFFKTRPLPCDPFSLPKYPPSKEFDAKLREEAAAMRWRVDRTERHGAESTRMFSKQSKGITTPGFESQGQSSKRSSNSVKYNSQGGRVRGYPIEQPRVSLRNGLSHSSSVLLPKTGEKYASSKQGNVNLNQTVAPERTSSSSKHDGELVGQVQMPQSITTESASLHPRVERNATQDPSVYVPKRKRMVYSGPLVPPGGNMEDMLKEHERQIQEAVRKARVNKVRSQNKR